MDSQKFSTNGSFAVVVVIGVCQIYVWHKHGDLTVGNVSNLAIFGCLVGVLFASAVINYLAARKNAITATAHTKLAPQQPVSKQALPPLPSALAALKPATAAPPDQPSAPTKLADGRILLQLTPKQLSANFENATTAQGERAVQPYLGKWMEVTGKVNNVTHNSDNSSHISFYDGVNYFVFMFFKSEWYDHLAVLSKDQKISVRGKLLKVERRDVHLQECELV
jgi:hypothetical protein